MFKEKIIQLVTLSPPESTKKSQDLNQSSDQKFLGLSLSTTSGNFFSLNNIREM